MEMLGKGGVMNEEIFEVFRNVFLQIVVSGKCLSYKCPGFVALKKQLCESGMSGEDVERRLIFIMDKVVNDFYEKRLKAA